MDRDNHRDPWVQHLPALFRALADPEQLALIDYYAAWAWKPLGQSWQVPQSANPMHGPSPIDLAKTWRWPDEDWWRAFVGRGRIHRHDQFYGGSDALYLLGHTEREDSTVSASPVLHLDSKHRHGVLITEGLRHWHADLHALGKTLPSLGRRSWHIEVFDRCVGYLGVFRQSRVTGAVVLRTARHPSSGVPLIESCAFDAFTNRSKNLVLPIPQAEVLSSYAKFDP